MGTLLPQTPYDTHSNPVPGRACAEVMQHDGGGGPGEGPQSPAPCPQGRLSRKGGGPLEARDERAAWWPWAHAGTQDAVSSS